MASQVSNRFLGEAWIGNVNLDTGSSTVRVALLSSTYTPDPDHEVWADLSGYETAGTGYTANGAVLAGQSVTVDDTSDLVYFDGNDVAWGSSTVEAQYVAVYIDSHASDLVICVHDIGSSIASTGATWTAQWSASGICRIT